MKSVFLTLFLVTIAMKRTNGIPPDGQEADDVIVSNASYSNPEQAKLVSFNTQCGAGSSCVPVQDCVTGWKNGSKDGVQACGWGKICCSQADLRKDSGFVEECTRQGGVCILSQFCPDGGQMQNIPRGTECTPLGLVCCVGA